MAGIIRTSEKCPKCGEPFASIPHPAIPKEQIDLLCRTCLTRPVKVWIDGRGLRDKRGEPVGYIPEDQNGEPFLSFHAARLTLSTIWKQKKEGTLDARAWQRDRSRRFLLPDLRDEYVSALLRGGRGRGHRNQAERVLTELVEVVGAKGARALSGEDLLALDKAYKARGVSGPVRKKYHQQVQAFIRWFNTYILTFKERIEVPPLPLIDLGDRREIGWIDSPEQGAVLEHIRYRHLHLTYRVLFATGMRIGEACGLRKRDLIRQDGLPFVYVQRAIDQWGKKKGTKTGAWMMKPVPEDLFVELEGACKEKFPESYIWTTRYGNPYSPQRLSMVWHEAAIAARVNINLYAAVRHSKATRRMIDLQKEMWREVAGVLGDTEKIARGYVRSIDSRRVKGAVPGEVSH